MINLDSQKEIEEFDKGKILASIRMLPDQIEQAWEEIKNIDIPKPCYRAKNVVICGMGGSALGGRIVDSLTVDRVRTPVEIFTEYDIPSYTNPETLVILNSYSGNTEETLSAAHQALSAKANILGITTGGKLAKFLDKEDLPAYIYEPKANPSAQPRMGLGYSISATMSLLAKCGFIQMTHDDVYSLVVLIRNFIKEFEVDIRLHDNIAKKTAQKLKNKLPVIISARHLKGVSHAFKNQLNENSKVTSFMFDLPELNHHLLEGLRFPAKARETLHFFFFDSDLYSDKINRRVKLTKEVIEKNGYHYGSYPLRSDKKLSQIFEVLCFGSFVSFYLAIIYGVDPSKIPWVDYFKERLSK
jgi:glucose/mannose-6-phosphate isomerase